MTLRTPESPEYFYQLLKLIPTDVTSFFGMNAEAPMLYWPFPSTSFIQKEPCQDCAVLFKPLTDQPGAELFQPHFHDGGKGGIYARRTVNSHVEPSMFWRWVAGVHFLGSFTFEGDRVVRGRSAVMKMSTALCNPGRHILSPDRHFITRGVALPTEEKYHPDNHLNPYCENHLPYWAMHREKLRFNIAAGELLFSAY